MFLLGSNMFQGDINQLNICHEDDYIEFTLRDHPLRSSISQVNFFFIRKIMNCVCV